MQIIQPQVFLIQKKRRSWPINLDSSCWISIYCLTDRNLTQLRTRKNLAPKTKRKRKVFLSVTIWHIAQINLQPCILFSRNTFQFTDSVYNFYMKEQYSILTLRASLTGQTLNLLPNGHEFESSRDHWRLTWSLTSGSIELVEVHTSWPGHPR